MAHRSSNAHPARRTEPDDAASADGAVDPYDLAYIFRSIFGSKMKGHWQTWPFIDVDELRQINPDCVGWVHMDASPIDYPVVKQRFDRGYYLTHNFSGEESVHGQVAMDFLHGGRMGERATVLHAHHMKDWSMFKAIVSLEDPGYLAAHPTVGFVHEGARYDARWFAGVCYRASDPWPERTRFADDADYAAWIDRVVHASTEPALFRPGARDRVLVCCTCANNPDPTKDFDMFAAFGAVAIV